MRIFGNLFRSFLYLAMGSLVGYYSFDSGGIINLLTNVFFFALGLLMVTSWQSKPKKPFEQLSETASLNDQNIDANAAEDITLKEKCEL